MTAMEECSWCGTLTSHTVLIERRVSKYTTNTPGQYGRVRSDRRVPACKKCKSALIKARDAVKAQKEAADRMAVTYLQTTVDEQIALIEDEERECLDPSQSE